MANEIQADYASGNALYAVIRNRAGHVWHPGLRIFEAWGTSGHVAGDYHLALVDKTGSRYVGDFDTHIPAGPYSIQIFLQIGVTPADTDTLVTSREMLWTGTGELTAAKILANKAVQDTVTKTIDYYDDDGRTILLSHVLRDEASTFTRTPD